ncbi:hypothetical protein J437_LFUL000231 [Ladona fulva]|uniref:Non-canonical purine NTP phosphatase/PRRC1 domain-containing protein n=1 Tax=Ladona fulva TaxID=123851 RepID=A0A8K0NV04_LADFU|nr:hypothetical protein J437_LFUL000231 [Ladona fulva]
MQDDSNGESSFEFVEKRIESLSTADVVSQTSTDTRTSGINMEKSLNRGNILLSNVSPPTTLPSFAVPVSQLPTQSKDESKKSTPVTSSTKSAMHPVIVPPVASSMSEVPAHIAERTTPKFSAAIPPSMGSTTRHEDTDTKDGHKLDICHGDAAGRGIMSWVKDAVGSSGGLLSRVAEKAKNSVDSMITTLDPQMKEFIYSGGDMDVIVASDKEVKVSPVREAFQTVFGRATVMGVGVQPTMVAAQPVGFLAGVKGAQERIAALRALPAREPSSLTVDDTMAAVVAVESFLLEAMEERWYEASVIVLSDKQRGIELHTYTQLTPVPASIVAQAHAETPKDYPLSWSGLSVTIGSLMEKHLEVEHTEWHQVLTGVTRREMLLMAARTLAGLYKNSLSG